MNHKTYYFMALAYGYKTYYFMALAYGYSS